MTQPLAVDIIKRRGQRATEGFDEAKLHASIVAACLSTRTASGQAELIADKVTEHVMGWLESRPTVTSHDLRRVAVTHLTIHHPDAGYLYQQHQITI